MNEINEILRIREKFEQSLPIVIDQETKELREKLIHQYELKEWKRKELLIKQEQDAKLQVLSQQLSKREELKDNLNQLRINKIKQETIKLRDLNLKKLKAEKEKATRNLKRIKNHIV